jgi:hypothetical protein
MQDAFRFPFSILGVSTILQRYDARNRVASGIFVGK